MAMLAALKIPDSKKIMRRWAISSLCILLVTCTPKVSIDAPDNVFVIPKTTYQKYLIRANDGDTTAQNLIGYMLYYGEGVKQDYEKAHYWFHSAAEQGEARAKRNLGLFHAKVNPKIPEIYYDSLESNKWLSKADKVRKLGELDTNISNYKTPLDYFRTGSKSDIGEKVYWTFCAGCHGFTGIAAYEAAPSFVSGDRLDKTDAELLESISDGKALMPAWRDILPAELRSAVLHYIRTNLKGNQQSKEVEFGIAKAQSLLMPNNLGAQTYSKFCAGCHGFNGIAYYVNSPSFALGQRMGKSNAILKNSILKGHSIMPGWDDKLTQQQIDSLVLHIRKFEASFDIGIERKLDQPLGLYFIFPPLK